LCAFSPQENAWIAESLAKGFALHIPPGYGARRSGVRSQDRSHISVEQLTGFFQGAHQRLVLAVPQVLGQNQIVPALFEGTLRNIQESGFLSRATLAGALSNVGRNGNGRTASVFSVATLVVHILLQLQKDLILQDMVVPDYAHHVFEKELQLQRQSGSSP
jgi:hypothetical protein